MTENQLKRFYELYETHNSWGKNQVKQLLLEVIEGIK